VSITSVSRVNPTRPGGNRRARPARSEARRRHVPYLLLLPGLLWLGVFFVVPIVTLLGTSTQTRVPGGEIGEFTQTLRLANYWDALSRYQEHFGRSVLYAGVATLAALIIGYPLAYMIAFRAGRWRNVLLVLVIAPFFCSFILRTYAWRQILADEGTVVRTLKWMHLMPEGASLTATSFAVVCGLTYNFLPFMTLPVYASLERIDHRLLEAGYDLYGGPWTVLRRVTFPLSMPGVVAGTLLTFIPAAGDFVNAGLLGTTRTQMIGNVIESRFVDLNDYATAACLSFLMMAVILALVLVYIRRTGTEELV